jgi:signal transduction histidine kinase
VGGERLCDGDCPILAARYRGPARALERLAPGGRKFAAVLTSSPPSGGIQVQVLREETADEAALRARDELVADLAHELKTPLAAQRASLELLRDRLAESDAEASGLAAAAQSGTARLERLIENLLESVRIESGQAALRRAEVDLEEVVEEAVSLTAPLIAKRKQRLEIDLAYPLQRPVGDAPRLVQVLVNLLANASKFAPEGSEIRLAAESGTGEVRLWVEDEGPGLDPEVLAGEPARFRRGAAGSGASRQSGDGLGLRIARSIVERHGAALAAERRKGRTRVGFGLPVEGAP